MLYPEYERTSSLIHPQISHQCQILLHIHQQILSHDLLKQVSLMNKQLSFKFFLSECKHRYAAAKQSNKYLTHVYCLQHQHQLLLQSQSNKTNTTAPTEDAKRGRRSLPRDPNGKLGQHELKIM